MGIECAYSFKDLYQATFGKEPGVGELEELYLLPQTEKNAVVAKWAKQAGWLTAVRLGTDGVEYLAFYPPAGSNQISIFSQM